MNHTLILQCSHLQWYTDMMQATMCEKDLEFLGWFHLQRTIEWFWWIRTLSKATLFTFHFVLLHLAIIDYQQYHAVVSQKAIRTHPNFSLDTYALLHRWRVSRYMNCMLFKVAASDVATWKRTKDEPYPALPQPTTLLTRSTSNEIRSAVATMPLPPDPWKTRLILRIVFRSLKAQLISSVLLPMSRSRISHHIALAIYYRDLFTTTCHQQLSVHLARNMRHLSWWTRMLYQTMMILPTLITLDDYLENGSSYYPCWNFSFCLLEKLPMIV